mgnify:CR=1 FL=1
MKTIIITIQDKDHGEFISSRVVETYNSTIDEGYLISLVKKAEKDLEKLIWQRELKAAETALPGVGSKILKSEKKP